ncbi:MAG TPA: class I SAM-dependent methyltransferase, partial [Mycobacterium sp.]|nr:class I SAM-dependent methyltransferase [Mycobacterium sp.]
LVPPVRYTTNTDRPPPQTLIEDLVALTPSDVLDIGCGTGKVAVEFMKRGMRVLGVDVDERMTDYAREHGVPVEIASFESWDAKGRQFDLITCADAWHWIDPARGSENAAAVLRCCGAAVLRNARTFLELLPSRRRRRRTVSACLRRARTPNNDA